MTTLSKELFEKILDASYEENSLDRVQRWVECIQNLQKVTHDGLMRFCQESRSLLEFSETFSDSINSMNSLASLYSFISTLDQMKNRMEFPGIMTTRNITADLAERLSGALLLFEQKRDSLETIAKLQLEPGHEVEIQHLTDKMIAENTQGIASMSEVLLKHVNTMQQFMIDVIKGIIPHMRPPRPRPGGIFDFLADGIVDGVKTIYNYFAGSESDSDSD